MRKFGWSIALLLWVPLFAWSQPYPSKPIKLYVGFAPGGGTDITARIIAPKLGEVLGQTVLVENRAGAGGNIATDTLAKSPPDGYTIMLSSVGPLTVSPHMSKLPYDPFKDVVPLSLGVNFSNVLVVNPSVKASTVAEFVTLAKDPKANITYGSSGIGSSGHLAGELFKMMAKVDIQHIAYRGGGPAMTDLIGGSVPAMFATSPTVLGQLHAGKIRALAVTGPKRSASLPNVPTIAESGFPGYEATNWYAFIAPANTPREIVAKLNAAIVKTLNDPAVHEKLKEQGMEAQPSTPEEMTAFMKKEYEIWGRVVKQADIKAE
jgi:Uncharacterized protein conserved in bacteria